MKIFISYSRKDKRNCDAFRTALEPLKRTHGVEILYDGNVLAGGDFIRQLDEALEAADIVVLLISPYYMASEYCYNIEMVRALERRAEGKCIVVPVIVEYVVDWVSAPFGHIAALPEGGKPIKSFSPRSKGWGDVAKGLQRLVEAYKPKLPRTLIHLPIPHNPLFTGRAKDLNWIGETLARGEPVALLHGMGGVGKTLTAAEFARAHAAYYTTVWWVVAETASEADAGYGALAKELSLPGYDPQDAAATRKAVVDWMDRDTGWLVVLDNAESPAALKDWLPHAAKGHLLITSRNPDWKTRAKVHPIDVWPVAVAADFLMERSGDHDRAAAEKLAETLGALPLACEQAGAYVAETGCGLSGYAELLETEAAEMLATLPADPTYPRSLAATVTLAVEVVGTGSPLAVAILRALAWLAADGIPRWLLDTWPAEETEVDDALALLLRRALLRRGDDGMFAVHRLTQSVVRGSDPQPLASAGAAIRVVSRGVEGRPQFNVNLWPRYAALLPHGAALFALLPDPPPEPDAAAPICGQLGLYLRHAHGDHLGARTWYERELRLTETLHGPDHPETAVALANLADLSGEMGDYVEAKSLFQRALAINETALGPDHPNVASLLTGLGAIHNQLGELDDARRCQERALQIDGANFGPDQLLVATALNNLAVVLQKQGDLAGARAHYERALAINVQHPERGPDHPQTALRYHNLGIVLYKIGDLATAEPHLLRALQIFEKHLAPGHPSIENSRNWLDTVRAGLGKENAPSVKLLQPNFERIEGDENTSIEIPDLLDLAFFLVVDNRAAPDLLTGLTAGGLRDALEAYRGPKPGLLPGDALAQLRITYLGLEPDPLWKAWNLETAADTLPTVATELIRTAWAKLQTAGNA